MDACNGWAAWAEGAETHQVSLAANVADAIRLDGLVAKWGLADNGLPLVNRLNALSPAEAVAVVEAVEAFWARAAKPTDEIFAELGLPTE